MDSGNTKRNSAKESQERYQAFLRSSQEGIWRVELKEPISVKLPVKKQIELIHRHAYFAEANLALAKMFGFPSEKPLIGMQLTALITPHPDSIPLTAFIKNGYNLSGVETEEKDRQGNDRYVRHSLIGIIENGHLVRAWGTLHDITEQRMAQLSQQKSEAWLKLALKATNTGIWEWDVKTKELVWSEELFHIFGLAPGEKITFKKFLGLVHPEDREKLDESVQGALVHKKYSHVEYRIIRPDGSIHWVLSLGRAYPEAGEASHMMGTCMIIDDRKEYESHLIESENRFRMVADSAPVLIWMSDPDAYTFYFNKPWLDFTGRTLQQELGDGWAEGAHPEDREPYLKIFRSSVKKRQPYSKEYRLRRHDGEYRWMVDHAVPRYSPDGEYLGLIGGCADINDIKITIRRNAELEVFNAQLLELNSAKDEFISIASHQLRTPATNVKQYIGMLMGGFGGDINEEQLGMLRVAYESNDREINIINDLLRVARIDAGKITLSIAKCDFVGLVKEVLDEQEPKIGERQQKLSFSFPRKDISVQLDKQLFRMVIENLVDNASKYSPKDAKVIVRITPEPKYVVMSIKDTGIGMGKKDQEKLFQKFFRIQNHTTARIEGTGLGLYWCKKIVDLHGGELSLKSSPGKGSEFTVRLPLKMKRTATK